MLSDYLWVGVAPASLRKHPDENDPGRISSTTSSERAAMLDHFSHAYRSLEHRT